MKLCSVAQKSIFFEVLIILATTVRLHDKPVTKLNIISLLYDL